MILLDTNVVSEMMRDLPDSRVLAWLDERARDSMYLSAISAAELRSGLARMPCGKRQRLMMRDLEARVLPMFDARIIAFDFRCTPAYAALSSQLAKAGQPASPHDALIAATALTHSLRVATRDKRPFLCAGIDIVDPWLHD